MDGFNNGYNICLDAYIGCYIGAIGFVTLIVCVIFVTSKYSFVHGSLY